MPEQARDERQIEERRGSPPLTENHRKTRLFFLPTWPRRRITAGSPTLMWKLSIEDDQANQTGVDLSRDEYAIGRDVGNTVWLTERNILPNDAVLRKKGGRWLVQDRNNLDRRLWKCGRR